MALGSFSRTLNSPLIRSSKSPLYLVPANMAPKSKLYTTLLINVLGTSPSTIFLASPSAIAVLPVPGSPTSTQLFFLRLANTCTNSSTSSCLPISGSILLLSASSFKLIVNSSRSSRCTSMFPCCLIDSSTISFVNPFTSQKYLA